MDDSPPLRGEVMTREQIETLAQDALKAEGWITYDVSNTWKRAECGELKIAGPSWGLVLEHVRRRGADR